MALRGIARQCPSCKRLLQPKWVLKRKITQIGDQNCSEAMIDRGSYACKNNSVCHGSDNGPGYQCSCPNGFEGNPYHKNGRQDIDECQNSTLCVQKCINFTGTYNCSCEPGYEGDGKYNGTGCRMTTFDTTHEQDTRRCHCYRLSANFGDLLAILGT
ncbi:hypothetical protein ACB092_12G157800 [Castanea dentata]